VLFRSLPLALLPVGNAPEFSVTLTSQTETHKESTSGQRLVDLRFDTEVNGEVTMTLEELLRDNLQRLLRSTASDVSSSTVTGEVITAVNPLVGQVHALAKSNVSSVVLTNASAATIPASQYRVARHGSVEWLNVASATAPISAAYSYGAAEQHLLLTQPADEYWLRFEGVNTTPGAARKHVVLDLYRVQLGLPANLGLINDALFQLPVGGAIMADTSKELAGAYGQFGRLTTFGA
jgi:hypothetical protein